MPAVSVLILYNEPVLPAGHPNFDSEHDVLNTVEAVGKALAEAGFAVCRLGLGRDPGALVERLAKSPPNVVFNLFEGTADQGRTEAYAAGLLEWLGVPFTGCPLRGFVPGQKQSTSPSTSFAAPGSPRRRLPC